MNNTSTWEAFKSTIAAPIGPWLSFAASAIYVMSLFLFYFVDEQEFDQLEDKTTHTALGFVLLWIIAVLKSRAAAKAILPAYIVGVLLLIGVEVAGATVNGPTCWLSLSFTRIQPSEVTKIDIPMTIAWHFQRCEGHLKWIHYIVTLVLILAPATLTLGQPDLGTAVLIVTSGIFVIFFVGLPWRAIFAAIVAFVAILPLLQDCGMYDCQKTRVLTLLNPTKDPLGAGHRIIRSMITIGSGGVWGKGWLNGTQTHSDYIPESATDFIFVVFDEELSSIGSTLLLLVYLITLTRGLWTVAQAQFLYSRTLADALIMIFFRYVFVNMDMVSDILPAAGAPLSLIGYGGTATLSAMAALVLLMGTASGHKNLCRRNMDSGDLTESRE